MEKILSTKKFKKLYQAFLSLRTEKECQAFLRDLCTIAELMEIAKRWEAVLMIQDKVPYREIAKKTGLSTATVTRIAHWLNYGEGGYRLALKRVKK